MALPWPVESPKVMVLPVLQERRQGSGLAVGGWEYRLAQRWSATPGLLWWLAAVRQARGSLDPAPAPTDTSQRGSLPQARQRAPSPVSPPTSSSVVEQIRAAVEVWVEGRWLAGWRVVARCVRWQVPPEVELLRGTQWLRLLLLLAVRQLCVQSWDDQCLPGVRQVRRHARRLR